MFTKWRKGHWVRYEGIREAIAWLGRDTRQNRGDIVILKHDLGEIYKQLAAIERTIRGDK